MLRLDNTPANDRLTLSNIPANEAAPRGAPDGSGGSFAARGLGVKATNVDGSSPWWTAFRLDLPTLSGGVWTPGAWRSVSAEEVRYGHGGIHVTHVWGLDYWRSHIDGSNRRRVQLGRTDLIPPPVLWIAEWAGSFDAVCARKSDVIGMRRGKCLVTDPVTGKRHWQSQRTYAFTVQRARLVRPYVGETDAEIAERRWR